MDKEIDSRGDIDRLYVSKMERERIERMQDVCQGREKQPQDYTKNMNLKEHHSSTTEPKISELIL